MFFLRRRTTTEVPRRSERIMKGGTDAEECYSIDKEMDDFGEVKIRISSRKDDRKHQNDLTGCSQFAIDAGREGPISGNKQNHNGYHKNQYVSAENNNREPPRNLFLKRQNDERRRKKQFIGDRIEVRAKRRTLIKAAREQAVNSV